MAFQTQRPLQVLSRTYPPAARFHSLDPWKGLTDNPLIQNLAASVDAWGFGFGLWKASNFAQFLLSPAHFTRIFYKCLHGKPQTGDKEVWILFIFAKPIRLKKQKTRIGDKPGCKFERQKYIRQLQCVCVDKKFYSNHSIVNISSTLITEVDNMHSSHHSFLGIEERYDIRQGILTQVLQQLGHQSKKTSSFSWRVQICI